MVIGLRSVKETAELSVILPEVLGFTFGSSGS